MCPKVDILLDANANLSSVSAEGKTPLIHAIERGHTGLASELLIRLALGRMGPESQAVHGGRYIEHDDLSAMMSASQYRGPHVIDSFGDDGGFGLTYPHRGSLPRKSIQRAGFGPSELPQSLYPMWMPGNKGVLGAGEEMRMPSRISWSKSTNELLGEARHQLAPRVQTRAEPKASGVFDGFRGQHHTGRVVVGLMFLTCPKVQ